MLIKKSTSTKIPFFMTDSTDTTLGKTGLTVTVTISKNGAAFGSPGGSVTEIGSGWYYLDANTTDTNTAGALLLHATATGAIAEDKEFQVLDNLPGELATATIQAIWDALTSALTTSGSIGKLLVDKIDATISSRSTLDAAGVWDRLTSAITTSGSIGKLIKDNVDATLSTIASYIDTEVAAIKAKTDNLPSDPADASDIAAAFATVNSTLSTIAGYVDTEVAAIKAKTDNLPADTATVLSTLSSDVGAIPTNPLLDDDARLDNLDATISSRLAAVAYVEPENISSIRKNQPKEAFTFVMYDESGLPLTGLTVTATRKIDGGSYSACANAVSEIGTTGRYEIDLDASDLNGDVIAFRATADGARDTDYTFLTES